jgi:hypothetical protein
VSANELGVVVQSCNPSCRRITTCGHPGYKSRPYLKSNWSQKGLGARRKCQAEFSQKNPNKSTLAGRAAQQRPPWRTPRFEIRRQSGSGTGDPRDTRRPEPEAREVWAHGNTRRATNRCHQPVPQAPATPALRPTQEKPHVLLRQQVCVTDPGPRCPVQ